MVQHRKITVHLKWGQKCSLISETSRTKTRYHVRGDIYHKYVKRKEFVDVDLGFRVVKTMTIYDDRKLMSQWPKFVNDKKRGISKEIGKKKTLKSISKSSDKQHYIILIHSYKIFNQNLKFKKVLYFE